MKKITPNIALEDCEHKVEYYQNVFGGGRLSGGSRTPEGKLLHLELQVNPDCVLYFNDAFGEVNQGDNISLVLEMDDMEEIERLYGELQKGGTVRFELQKTFWGAYHAVIEDRHGIVWSLNYSI